MIRIDSQTLVRPGSSTVRGPARHLNGPAATAVLYLAAITAAEALTVRDPRVGLPLHALILGALLLHGGWTPDEGLRRLLWGMTLTPLIRMLSLSLPLEGIPLPYWYAIIAAPIFAAVAVIVCSLGCSRGELGLTLRLRYLPLTLLMVPFGSALGVVEYLILLPRPLASTLTLAETWQPALILIIATGFFEELIFRGLIQSAAIRTLGAVGGILYVAVLFTSLHLGYLSAAELSFVFPVGLAFGVVAWRTGSILGPTLAHAANNVTLLLIAPLLLPSWLETGPRTPITPARVIDQRSVVAPPVPRVLLPTVQPGPVPAQRP